MKSSLSLTSLALLISTLLVAASAGDITITDWNVTMYEDFDDDTNTTYFKYKGIMGDTITWTGEGMNNTYLFEDEDDYELCNFTYATLVDGGVFESWPEGTNWKNAVKGSRYFGLNDTSSENCTKIEILFKNKKAALKGKKKECSDSQSGLIEAKTFSKGSYGKCKNVCAKNKECKTVEAIKATDGSLTCTLYSDEAIAFGSKNKKARCFTLKYED